MATPITITEFLGNKITLVDNIPYNDFIILGTFGIIIHSNQELVDFLNTNKGANDDWDYDETDIFGFVSQKLLKTKSPPTPPTPPTESSDFTVDFNIDFSNNGTGFTVHFNTNEVQDGSTFSADKTKEKFNKAFVNLAQVFYETGFCTNFTLTNTDKTKFSHTDFDSFKESLFKFYNSRDTKFTKSIKLVYYKDIFSNEYRAKLEEKNFKDYKNIEFEYLILRKNIKKNISAIKYKQNIIVYNVRKIEEKKIKSLFYRFTQRDYYLIIIINDSDNILEKKDLIKDKNIEILQLKFNSGANATATATATATAPAPATATATAPAPATTTKKEIKTITFKVCNPVVHDFEYFETTDTAKPRIKLIEYTQKEHLDKILDYFIQTNNIVFIESD